MNGILSDLSAEVSRRRTRDGRRPLITWEVGHLLRHRCQLLGLPGVEAAPPFAEPFSDAGATDRHDYPTVAELKRE